MPIWGPICGPIVAKPAAPALKRVVAIGTIAQQCIGTCACACACACAYAYGSAAQCYFNPIFNMMTRQANCGPVTVEDS